MISKEMKRLNDYSNPANTPYLFSSSVAFETAKSVPNMELWNELESEFANDFKKISSMLNSRKQVLECLAPSFNK